MTKASHEDIFIQSYSRLQSFAAQITRQDRALAEDLLHDAFIQFTITQPDLDNIQNLDGYLYGVIRNLYLSHLRKTARRNKHQLSVIDFETVRLGLKNVNIHHNFQTQEDLKRICYYVCLRKETARAASVMILRFFHGYFPSEIAEILRTTTQAVKVRLKAARIEAKSILDNPDAVRRIEEKLSPELILTKSFRSESDLIRSLGEMIFRSQTGACLADGKLKALYLESPAEPIETRTLAHIVSCRKCLDKINSVLGLLPISERYSVDYVGKDNGDQSGGPTGSGGNMDEAKITKIRQSWRRDAQEVFEHEPQLLFISIDGHLKSSQKIDQNHNRQSIKLDAEPLEFVEVLSEQNVRLAFISLDELFLDGTRSCLVNLSDDRTLNLQVTRTASETQIEAVYIDPHFLEIEKLLTRELASNRLSDFLQSRANVEDENLFAELPTSGRKKQNSLTEFFGNLKDAFFPSRLNFNPVTTGAVLSVFIILTLVAGRFLIFAPAASAREILARAENSEQASEAGSGTVVYRAIKLEERKTSGEVLRKSRIETWLDSGRHLTVRRLYNEKNELVAGEWRRADGVSTYYQPNMLPALRRAVSDKDLLAGKTENIWQLSVSAKGFESIIETPEKAELEEKSGSYVISFQTGREQGLIKAVLVLNKELRTREQALIIRKDGEEREFRFTETHFEYKGKETVRNSVFEPEKELVKQSSVAKTDNLGENEKTESEPRAPETEQTVNAEKNLPAEERDSPLSVSQELEVKVLELLSGVNALSGDQLNIVKTPNGKLRISGVVDARSRKDEILNALSPVSGNPAIQINILTPEEIALNKTSKRNPNEPTAVESVTVESRNSIPAGDILRNYFSRNGLSEDKIEAEIRRYASSVLAKSSQMRRAALSTKQIAERFPAAELEKMDEKTRAQWRNLIRQNAAGLLRQAESLRGELRPVFRTDGAGGGGNINSADDTALIRAAGRLFELSLTVDRDVRSSFSHSNANAGNPPVESGRFENALSEIINLSRQFK